MRYIEITIWEPSRKSFDLKPRFEWWTDRSGFDFDWLIFSFNVNLKRYENE